MLNKFNVPCTEESVVEAISKTQQAISADHYQGKDIGFSMRLRNMLTLIAPTATAALGAVGLQELKVAYDRLFLQNPPQLVTDTLPVLEHLASYGLGLGLISNTGFTSPEAYHSLLKALEFTRWIRVALLSNETSLAKPSQTIFERAAAQLNVCPHHVLHVGDDVYTDVTGAAQVGMRTVWAKSMSTTSEPPPADFIITDVSELQHWSFKV